MRYPKRATKVPPNISAMPASLQGWKATSFPPHAPSKSPAKPIRAPRRTILPPCEASTTLMIAPIISAPPECGVGKVHGARLSR